MAVMNSDGTILKSPNNPIIDEQPEGLIGEIRDPFVFEKEGAYMDAFRWWKHRWAGKIDFV